MSSWKAVGCSKVIGPGNSPPSSREVKFGVVRGDIESSIELELEQRITRKTYGGKVHRPKYSAPKTRPCGSFKMPVAT